MRIVDLFAGPGGWDTGARQLGLDPLGVEWDDAACATREKAGLQTVQGDVSELDPHDFGPIDGLIASPPCQAWSLAGKGGGRRDVNLIVRASHELAAGNDTRAEYVAKCEDPRSVLVCEPLRWTIALEPEWIAFEQVAPVLGYWTLLAGLLERFGYRTWVGVLEAERYGVPQTRERAVLLGKREAAVAPPEPTHQRYVPGEPQMEDDSLFGSIAPWVSMADAIGWGFVERPSFTITGTSGFYGGSDNRDYIWKMREETPHLWIEKPRPSKSKYEAISPSVEEAARLQSFPDGYPFQGSKSARALQVGNAVPPQLAKAILQAVAL